MIVTSAPLADVSRGDRSSLLSTVFRGSLIIDRLVVQRRIRAIVAENLVVTETAVARCVEILFKRCIKPKTVNTRVATSSFLRIAGCKLRALDR